MQLCVWEGTTLEDGEMDDFVLYFKQEFGVRVKYEAQVKTLPDRHKNGSRVKGTGGRNDLFFYIHGEDVAKFAIPRFRIGVRWFEDVVANSPHLYEGSVIKKYTEGDE
jgi:hypothetical protein